MCSGILRGLKRVSAHQLGLQPPGQLPGHVSVAQLQTGPHLPETRTTHRQNRLATQTPCRYNGLTTVMKQTLKETVRALKGLVVMSPDLEDVSSAVFDNRVPALWEAKAYPSLKPLSSWVSDLLERLAFVQRWIDGGVPAVYWISGFFFPQAFLTGTLQNFARRHSFPIDTVRRRLRCGAGFHCPFSCAPPTAGAT